jgi:hypothetical protein
MIALSDASVPERANSGQKHAPTLHGASNATERERERERERLRGKSRRGARLVCPAVKTGRTGPGGCNYARGLDGLRQDGSKPSWPV